MLGPVTRRNGAALVAALSTSVAAALAVVVPGSDANPGPAGGFAHVYWSEPETSRGPSGTGIDSIWRASATGGSVDKNFVSGLQIPGAVAVNSSHLYWSDEESGTIGRARIDGTHVQRSLITTNAEALAATGGFLYWTTSGSSGTRAAIWRSELDGSHTRRLLSIGTGTYIGGLAVNRSHVYWTNRDRGTIGRASLDGGHAVLRFIAGLTDPTGLALGSHDLFWANTVPGSTDSLGRAHLDGTDVHRRFITRLSYPYGVAVGDRHLYWADYNRGTIGRADLDGRHVHRSFINAHAFYDTADPQYLAVGP
jgi:virginiamycin B lyase